MNKKGSALLVALIITSLLLAGSLFLSTVIFKDSKTTLDLLSANKAFYAAEAGVELSLYGLNSNLPGWQPAADGQMKILQVGDAVVEYNIDNRCNSFPCFEGVSNLLQVPTEELYYELDWNETIQIPMFYINEEGEVQDVSGFSVQFYSSLNAGDLFLATDGREGRIDALDILRWKIFGLKEEGGKKISESISDFTGVSMIAGDNGGRTDQSLPSWFGTVACTDINGLNRKIKCAHYGGGSDQHLKVDTYYDYQIDIDGNQFLRGEEDVKENYLISEFIRDHELNYLSLTNLVNRNLLGNLGNSDFVHEKSKIYLRVDFPEGELVEREFALIESYGHFENAKDSISVHIKRGEVMPVFNFALFSTGGEDDQN